MIANVLHSLNGWQTALLIWGCLVVLIYLYSIYDSYKYRDLNKYLNKLEMEGDTEG